MIMEGKAEEPSLAPPKDGLCNAQSQLLEDADIIEIFQLSES